MVEGGGLQCIWGQLNEHPQCPHGPTLLFEKYVEGDVKKFYACSACRDRKLCPFFQEYDSKQTKQEKQTWEQKKKEVLPRYDHQKMYIRFNEMMAENPVRRAYCHKCERLFFISDKNKHKDHEIVENLTDHQMTHPTELLRPFENAKKEAQYLFSKNSTETIVNMLLKLGAKQVLCIGVPRIHEYIAENHENEIASLLLDFDGRFHNFFGPLSYSWYNLFNNHFFHEDSKDIFKDFLTNNGGKNTYVICDPPYGGRLEAMSQTAKKISDLHRQWNKLKSDEEALKMMFILPYYMGPAMREKSNPPGISGGLKDLVMCDYKVDYDNHPLFAKGPKGRKHGSAARIFTNVKLNLLELPEEEGYKYCKRCDKWVSRENKHCKKCKECTSKDGSRYKHCKLCERCVKPTWKHCESCQRCALEKHNCGQVPKATGRCFKCDELGHVARDCMKSDGKLSAKFANKNGKRTQHQEEIDVPKKKKQKMKDVMKVSKKPKETSQTAEIVTNESVESMKPKKIKIKSNMKSNDIAITKKLGTKALPSNKKDANEKKKNVENIIRLKQSKIKSNGIGITKKVRVDADKIDAKESNMNTGNASEKVVRLKKMKKKKSSNVT